MALGEGIITNDKAGIVVNGDTLERQRVNIADSTTYDAVATVAAADPDGTEYALLARALAYALVVYNPSTVAAQNAQSQATITPDGRLRVFNEDLGNVGFYSQADTDLWGDDGGVFEQEPFSFF